MSIDHPENELLGILAELRKLPCETEWAEFKLNNAEPDEIGEYLSALANASALTGKVHAWLVWGVSNDTHEIIGTTFNPTSVKVGNEELESWLLRLLSPKINFRFYPLQAEGKPVILLEICAAFRHPVQFKGTEFIRVGSYKKKLKDFPEKERELWRVFDRTPFEKEIAAEYIPAEEVLRLLDYPAYFDLLSLPLLVQTDRFLDSPPRSRNEALASFMRRIGVCEERGSGVDKVVFQTEIYQLPAPLFETTDEHTRAVLFAHRAFKEMDKADRIRACYLHACLRYVQRNYMTNTTLRERFGIDEKNSSMASRIIKDAIEAGLIRCHDETVGSRARKYLPRWA